MPPQDTTHSQLLEYKITLLEARLSENEKDFTEFKAGIDAERSKYFLWGIGVLGSIVAGLCTTLYNILILGHPK